MALPEMILAGTLIGFSLAILGVAVVAYVFFRGMKGPVLQVRVFQHLERMERAFLAFVLSFIVFVPIAFAQALGMSMTAFVDLSLLGIHLALILYGFWQFLVLVRPQPSMLDERRRAAK